MVCCGFVSLHEGLVGEVCGLFRIEVVVHWFLEFGVEGLLVILGGGVRRLWSVHRIVVSRD